MNRVVINGPQGEVRWSYHRAATVGPWTLTAEPAGATLTATVVSSDAFAVSQQPLTFVVPRPSGASWTWPIVTLQIAGGSLTAELGPQE